MKVKHNHKPFGSRISKLSIEGQDKLREQRRQARTRRSLRKSGLLPSVEQNTMIMSTPAVTAPPKQVITFPGLLIWGDYVDDIDLAKRLITMSSSAEARGKPFTLTLKKLKSLIKVDKCFYTGQKFVHGDSRLAKTLDRVENSVGYEDGNVVVCCAYINRAKSDLSIEELKGLFNGITKHTKKLVKKPKSKTAKLRVLRSKAS